MRPLGGVGVALLLSFGALSLPRPAAAETKWLIGDRSRHSERPTKLDIVGHVAAIGQFDLGGAAWFSVPIVNDGLIKPANDALVLEAGASLDYFKDEFDQCTQNWMRFTPMAGLRWDFYLTPDWTLFAKGKLGYGLGFGEKLACAGGGDASGQDIGGVAFDGGLGAYLSLGEGMALRLDFSFPALLAAGISIDL